MGGYVKNMHDYLNVLKIPGVLFRPMFVSSRRSKGGKRQSFIVRAIRDITRFVVALIRERPDGVHLLGQYRDALPRELAIVTVARLFGTPIAYDIKAGAFESEMGRRGALYKTGCSVLLRLSSGVLVQGRSLKKFIRNRFSKSALYFPNYINVEELGHRDRAILTKDTIRVLFVGYCIGQKGVFELIDGCRLFASRGGDVVVVFCGQESPEFSRFCDCLPATRGLNIIRRGKVGRRVVKQEMSCSDIYGYLTRHPGEGHNNSITEALAYGNIVVTSNHGFINEIIDKDSGVLLQDPSSGSFMKTLESIDRHRMLYKDMGRNGQKIVLRKFTSQHAERRLSWLWRVLLN